MAKIAIIEDAPDNAEFLRIVVEAGGHLVECFGSGADFFATTRPKTFDLILLDISLPGLDGYETLQQVRNSDPDTPIVAVTAHAFPSEIQKGLDAGFSAYIVKPILDVDRFLAEIAEILRPSAERSSTPPVP